MDNTKPPEEREINTGRYAPSDIRGVCVCGHTLGVHDGARAKIGGKVFQYCQADDCGCECYRRKR